MQVGSKRKLEHINAGLDNTKVLHQTHYHDRSFNFFWNLNKSWNAEILMKVNIKRRTNPVYCLSNANVQSPVHQ